jgi:hypothetical protein
MGSAPTPAPAVDIEYLKMIQLVIDRLAGNSFQTKTWSVSLIAAILAFSTLSQQAPTAFLGLFPAICFFLLDAYYLRQERLFRALYRAATAGEAQRFSMDTSPYESRQNSLWSVIRSPAILLVHGPIMVLFSLVVVAFTILASAKGPK